MLPRLCIYEDYVRLLRRIVQNCIFYEAKEICMYTSTRLMQLFFLML
uniref:Uncharacterized protein n=1 Tax=Meloidogyne enterolobii TaxID=390850 RepID=A0A6V7XVQ7_MELEN|nr:unnamed protein product [Meloidogyne enterolobii]